MKKLNILIIASLFIVLVGCSFVSVNANSEKLSIIGHRGAMGYAPENTIESFRLAKEMEVDFLEFDVQMTKDGELIVMHDTKIDRTTNGIGEIKDMTLEEIKELDAGSWFGEQYSMSKVPTVREIFEEFGNSVNYYIETKAPHNYPGVEEKLIELLNEYNLLEKRGQVFLHSASKDSLKKMRELAPNTDMGLLFWYTQEADIEQSELEEIKEYADVIIANHNQLTVEYVDKVKSAGFSIHTYTVNEKEDFLRLVEWGIDGIITNYPDKLIEFLE